MDWKQGKKLDCRLEDIDDNSLEILSQPEYNGSSLSDRGRRRTIHSRCYPDYYAFYETNTAFNGFDQGSSLSLGGGGGGGDRSPSIHSMSAPLLNSPIHRNDELNYINSLGPVDVDSTYSYSRMDGPNGQIHPMATNNLHELNHFGSPKRPIQSVRKSRPSKPFYMETLYFRDGKRKVDFVLAYEDNNEQTSTAIRRRRRRQIFECNLEEEGLELELEDKMHSQDGDTFFLKIHAPWEVLTRYAELMNLKMPIKESDNQEEEVDSDFAFLPFKLNLTPFEYDKELIPDEPYYYTCAFNRERTKQFLIKSKDTFFNNAQRSRIVYEVLMRAKYDEDDIEKIGIQRMINNGSFTAAFALHEGSYSEMKKQDVETNNRRILYQEWARIRCFYKMQPLSLIRKYFGEKIGIYFAWLGFYTYTLTAPAIVGLLCFFYGLITLDSDIPTRDICDENGLGGKLMCPICEECPCKKLIESCDIAKVTYVFDNNATIFFSVFMSFWATLFLEFWKRQQARIAWEWDVANFEEEEEGLNKLQETQDANQEASADKEEVTCRTATTSPTSEPDFICNKAKATRLAATGSCIILMLLIALAAVLGVITYRIIIVSKLLKSTNEFMSGNADWISSITASLINFLFIVILDKIYYRVAKVLTNLEQPRTQTEYEDSFTFKMYLFQFINFYSSLIYIAFCKGRIKTENKGPIMVDQCDPTGCMFDLVIQLIIIMAGKQILNNVNEILTPVVLNWWRSRKSKFRTHDVQKGLYTRWEQDYDLASMDRMALFDEYIEMVIQYGFVTLFVSAFPLAPLFALLNNIVEIRLDAYKFVTQLRRPIAARAQDIGVWLGILKGISMLSVMTNAFIIAYTSDFIPRMVYQYYYSSDGTFAGYVNSTLSQYNTSDSEVTKHKLADQCWYVDHRSPPDDPSKKYALTLEYWHVFAARLAFVVAYEHLVFSLTGIVSYLVPDVPADVKMKLRNEKILAKEALYEAELEKIRREKLSRKTNADTNGFDSNSLMNESTSDLHNLADSQTDLRRVTELDNPSTSAHIM